MKKHLLTCTVACFSLLLANAETKIVEVKNFQFKPAVTNAVVGDVIQFVWKSGGHTATSTSVPAGAATWDAIVDEGHQVFEYTLTTTGTYEYWCTPHKPDMAGTLIVTGAMPVVLAYLNVNTSASKKALLSWKTMSEQNTASFIIKRSTDGNNFTEIARVNAAGNSNIEKSYSYTDNTISNASKYYYYMLQIADKDDRFTLSDIKLFRNYSAVPKLITSLSPNPISKPGHLQLQFNADKTGTMQVKLFDSNGKLTKQTEMSADIGLNNGHFHLGNIPAGVYTIVFTMDGIKETKSIVVQ